MEPCIIVGSSGHAHSVMEVLESSNQYEIIGFLDDFRVPGEIEHNLPILGTLRDCADFSQQYHTTNFFLGVGDNWARGQIYQIIKRLCKSAQFPSIAHSSAIISSTASIPDACVILPGTIVGRYATMGIGCLLNHQSCLDHDSCLGEFSSLGPQAAIGGRSRIGSFSAICMGAKVHQKINVGSHTIIGSGSVVTKEIQDHVVAYGVPCLAKRTRDIGERYL